MRYRRGTAVIALLACLAFCLMVSLRAPLGRSGLAVAQPLEAVARLELPRGPSSPSVEFVWGESVLEAAEMYMPETMTVFEVVRSLPTLDTVCDIADRLGSPVPLDLRAALLADPPSKYWDETGPMYVADMDDVTVECFSDGNFFAQWRHRIPRGRPIKDAVGVNETIAVAERFLAETGLLPPGCRLVEVTRVTSRSHHNAETGLNEDHILVRGAVYRRFHDGFPEGRLVVGVNGDGQVCEVMRRMRDIRPVGKYPILSPAEAAEALHSDAARIEGIPHARVDCYERAVIEKVEMEYWNGATAWLLDSIQPIYIFKGMALDRDGRSSPFKAMVPALRPPAGG